MKIGNLIIDGEFTKALERMESGEAPLFVTGKAGTGKSTLLSLWRGQTRKRVAVLAPTGVAALNVEGQTIHSFFKFKPGENIASLKERPIDEELRRIICALDAILIDEVSMVRADMLDMVDLRLRQALGKTTRAFGGMRLIFIGDLYQLPPVATREEEALLYRDYETPYFFSAKVFKETEPLEVLELSTVHRQQEQDFIEVLNAVRDNRLQDEHREMLEYRVEPWFKPPTDEEWITLTATNAQADAVNGQRLLSLEGAIETFSARVNGRIEDKEFPTAMHLALKVGAQVMTTINDVLGRWVNGSLGRVVGFGTDEHGNKTVRVRLSTGAEVNVGQFTWEVRRWRFDESKEEALQELAGSFEQFPLRLAWAVTIHKSQGKTFDRAIVDPGMGNLFAHGQLYVALSRCRTLDGLVLRRAVRSADMYTDRRVTTFMRQGKAEDKGEVERALEAAMEDQTPVELDMDTNAQDSIITFAPQEIGDFEAKGRTFRGVRGYCLSKKRDMTLRIDLIMAVRPASEEVSAWVDETV